VRISEASGRSVRKMLEICGKRVASVIPTIPQPAPSSMTLRFLFDSVLFKLGNCGKAFVFDDGPISVDIEVR
jgi:hypothetical protein